eukprot:gene9858-biopygen8121
MRAEAILAEEQAGFRRGRSTVEQIANVRILGEKYRNHQMELHHNFLDFKKAFDRVWREALWLVMKKHKIGAGLVTVIESLYNNNSDAVLMSNSELEWFQTTVGVRQGCVLSPCLFNIFLEQIMMEALEDYSGTVKVAGREINNLRFADNIDLVAGSKEELANLPTRLDTVSRKYGMEISAEKSKIMVTSRNDGSVTAADAQIKFGDVELEEVTSFQYLGFTLNESVTSETEIKKRLAIATNQLAKLTRVWNSSAISTAIKIRLMKSLITSIALYGCETWTHSKALEKRITAFEVRCFRRILGVTWKQKVTNAEIKRRITNEIGTFEPLLETARRRKLQWFGHTSRKDGTLAYDIMHGGVEGSRGRGRPRRTWLADIAEWTEKSVVECLRNAKDRGRWREIVRASKCPNGQQATGVT